MSLSVGEPVSYEQMDGEINMEGIHSPVCKGSSFLLQAIISALELAKHGSEIIPED